MKLTKQGVRDLSGPQPNGRKRKDTDTCFHVWRPDPSCPCRELTYDDFRGACWEICQKCGTARRS